MISRVFIERPRLSGVLSIILMLGGILALFSLPVAEYPPVTPPQVMVFAMYPGASAEVLKDTVAGPIEDAVNGVDDMIYLSSTSDSSGTYMLSITFEVGTDPNMAMVKVQNRVAQAEPLLPVEVKQMGVTVMERSSDMLGVVLLRSPDGSRDALFLSDYATKVIRPALERVPGVSSAQVLGPKYSMRVWLDSDRLSALGLESSDVLNAIRGQNIQASVGSVGTSPSGGDNSVFYTLKTEGRLNTQEGFEDIILRTDKAGAMVRLKDVARVEIGADSYDFSSTFNGEEAVPLMLSRATQANALTTMNNMMKEIESLSKQFPSGVEYFLPYDATEVVRVSVKEIVFTLLLTIVLVVVICYVFLQDWRATLIPMLTIPVSLLATFIVFQLLGYSINTLTLFGLVLAVGVVVDDAIVVVERVLYLMEHEDLEPKAATIKAMEQVTGPVIATTLVLLAIFIPIGFAGGITGKIYQQFAVSISTAVLFSSINALTLSPALCATMLELVKPKQHGPLRWFNTGLDRVRTRYVNTATRLSRQLGVTVFILLAVLAGVGIFSRINSTAFLPEEDKGTIFGVIQLPEGASQDRTEAAMSKFLKGVSDDPGVTSVIEICGFSISGGSGENVGFFLIKLDDWDKRKTKELQIDVIHKKYQARAMAFPDATIHLFKPPAISGIGAQSGMDIRLQAVGGGNPQELDAVLKSFLGALNAAPEIQMAFSGYVSDTPHLTVEIDRTKAALLDVDPGAIFGTLQNHLGSRYVNDVNFDGQVNKVIVQADWEFRDEVEDITALYTRSRTGIMVPLGSVLTISPSLAPRVIERYNKFTAASIQASIDPKFSSGQAMKAVQRIATDNLPEGYTFDWSGISYQENRNTASRGASFLVTMALIFGYLFLVAQYESWTIPVPVMASTAVAGLGALMGLYIMHIPLSIYAQLGLILLVGLACKNAILIVEFSETRRLEGLSIIEAAADGAGQRFRAVLMTAFTFIFGIFPMMFSTGAGAAARKVIGNTVFWGMLVATVFGIILIPALYVLFQTLREMGHRFLARNRNKNVNLLLLLLFLPMFFGGCIAVGPDYKTPELPDTQLTEDNTLAIADLKTWWTVLDDPELTAFVEAALTNNLDLKSAIASVRAARSRLGISRAALGPQLDASGNYTHRKTSDEVYGGGESDLYSVGFDAAWELDLFGGRRRATEAAKAEFEVSLASLADVQVTLAAETAQAYVLLRTYQQRLHVANNNLALQQQTYELMQDRYKSGLSDELAYQQARYNLESTRAVLPLLESGVEQAQNALAVLTGVMPGSLQEQLNMSKPVPMVPIQTVTGIPADLLRRRPDIRRAERALAAQTARIGIAKSDFYPKLFLNGSIGIESLHSGSFTDSGNDFYGIGPGVRWAIFRSGSIRGNVRLQEAVQEQYLAAYEKSILSAVEETRNALMGFRTEQQRSDALAQAVDAARIAANLAQDRYDKGLVPFSTVIDSQRVLLNYDDSLVQSRSEVVRNLIQLYKAIGGGWETPQP